MEDGDGLGLVVPQGEGGPAARRLPQPELEGKARRVPRPVIDGVMHIYYGAADTYVGLATVPVDELLNHVLKNTVSMTGHHVEMTCRKP